ncbi:MAG TPA: Crp/Fnr family transcriptional regulator [Ignavibacteriaceae bacterium]
MFDSKLVLKHVPLFSELDDSLLLKIEEAGIIRAYKKDSIIMDQMYEGTGLYIITSGTVKVTENNDQGGEIILDILGEFDYFGEMSLIDNKNPSANVVAMEKTELFFLAREEFNKLLKENPQIGIALLEEMTRRLRMSDSKIKSLSISNAEGRIGSAILQVAESSGTIHQGSVQVTLPYQHDIANLAGTSRETVSRVLHALERKGIIEFNGSKIRIPDYNSFRKSFS